MQGPSAGPECGGTIVRSTQTVPMRKRSAYWRDAISTVVPSLTVDYLSDEPPRARLESRPFADARVSRFIDDTPGYCQVVHTPRRSGWRDTYLLVLQMSGRGCYRHAGREAMLDCGDLLLLDMTRRFDLTFPKRHHEVAWELPRETLAPLLAAPERVGVRVSGNQGFGALLAGSIRALADGVGRVGGVSRRSLRLHLCNLAALAVGAALPGREARYETYRTARRQQILTYVEVHLREDSLTAERTARDLKISLRWLHELFSDGESTFAAWVAGRRVEECRKLLEDPGYDHVSISEIAFRTGFNDLSTFGRQFRAHCGMNPRDLRRGRALPGKARRFEGRRS